MRPAKQGADPRRKPASSRQFTSQIPESYFFRGLSSWAIQSPAAAVSIYHSCRAPVYRTTSTQNRSKPAAQPASPSNKRPRPTSCEKSKIRSPFNEKKKPGKRVRSNPAASRGACFGRERQLGSQMCGQQSAVQPAHQCSPQRKNGRQRGSRLRKEAPQPIAPLVQSSRPQDS